MENLDKENLVTVYISGNEGIISLAKSILDEAEIEYFVKNEGVQDFIGIGVLGTGFNPVTGAMQIKVLPENADYARNLLKDLDDSMEASGNDEGETGK